MNLVGKMNWNDLQYEKTPYGKFGGDCYGQSKRSQILMTVELADRLKGTKSYIFRSNFYPIQLIKMFRNWSKRFLTSSWNC